VESEVDGNREGRFLVSWRHLQRLAGSNPFFDVIEFSAIVGLLGNADTLNRCGIKGNSVWLDVLTMEDRLTVAEQSQVSAELG
jgi:hypothetical protein